jgi:hypothetical protein
LGSEPFRPASECGATENVGTSFNWTHDGREAVFLVYKSNGGDPTFSFLQTRIMQVKSDDSAPEGPTVSGRALFGPRFSPDDSLLTVAEMDQNVNCYIQARRGSSPWMTAGNATPASCFYVFGPQFLDRVIPNAARHAGGRVTSRVGSTAFDLGTPAHRLPAARSVRFNAGARVQVN